MRQFVTFGRQPASPHVAIRCLIQACALASLGADYRSTNFLTTAATEQLARQICVAAENHRLELANQWLGAPLAPWSGPCRVIATVNPEVKARGETTYSFRQGRPYQWQMVLSGAMDELLASVLPHEIMHVILATHFERPLPRWIEEGASVTVEDESSQARLGLTLQRVLSDGRAIRLGQLFHMHDYPPDLLTFYCQAHSVTMFLVEQGGRRKFVEFVSEGVNSEDWVGAMRSHYGYHSETELQDRWLTWVLPTGT